MSTEQIQEEEKLENMNKDTVKQVKKKVTDIHRKVARFMAALLILIISIGTPVLIVLALVETFKTANAAIEAVEPYCAARYVEDVKAYKLCVKSPANKILEDITAEILQATKENNEKVEQKKNVKK